MNLYIFYESNRSAIYGIGTYIRELTYALKNSDINLCVIHLRSGKPNVEIQMSEGVRYLYIPLPANLSANNPDWYWMCDSYYSNVMYLLKLYIKNTESLVFHLNYNTCFSLADELKKTFDCKIIMAVHYFEWCFTLLGNITQFRKILNFPNDNINLESIRDFYRKEKKLFETVDNIVCLSKKTRDILEFDYQINQKKISVIYNGLTDSHAAPDKPELLKKYHIPDIPIILFAGRLDRIKGLAYAIKAFKIVLNVQPACHFIIAGNGAFDAYMKECEDIWTHVTWTGLILREKLFDLYSIADIGVIPSFHEQCSYVAMEMMMHGLPVIGSTTTGLEEMIVDGETGWHIPVMEFDDSAEIDPSLLTEKILYLLQHTEKRRIMGMNARKRYEELYSSEVMTENMLNFYKSL